MDNIILSKKLKVSSNTAETQLNNNVCVIGCTGSGKSMSVIEPRLLGTQETNLIVYDPKRELHDKYRSMFLDRGYRVHELNLSNPSASDVAFDPMFYLSSDEDISVLANAIVNLTPQRDNSAADRYWEDSSSVLAKFGLYYVLATVQDATFADFLDFIVKKINIEDNYSLIKTSVDQYLEIIKEKHPNHPMIEPYEAFKVLPIKTAGCVFSTLRTTLTAVFNPGLKEMFQKKKSFDLKAFAKRKSVLFVTANGANGYLNAFVNMIFDMCINELSKIADTYESKSLPRPVHFIMDDFACGSVIKSFPEYISKFRSKGISSTIVLQSESQLKAMYGEYGSKTIMNNCDTLLYLGGSDKETAKDMAERLNVPLEKVLYMPLGDIIVFRRGSYPVIDRRYPILEDEVYRSVVRASGKLSRFPKTISENTEGRDPLEVTITLEDEVDHQFNKLFSVDI